jgi:hypothetical protein
VRRVHAGHPLRARDGEARSHARAHGDGVVSGADLSIILSNWGTLVWQPSIASVTPASGATWGGTIVTIRGAGFDAEDAALADLTMTDDPTRQSFV